MGVETLPPLKKIYLLNTKITLLIRLITTGECSYGKNNRKSFKAIRQDR